MVDRGANTSWAASGKATGTYYYQAMATNGFGDSAWSNLQSAVVAPPLPTHFGSTADATIAQGVPDFNGGAYDDILVGYEHCSGAANGVWRSLVRFDLSAIPPGKAYRERSTIRVPGRSVCRRRQPHPRP